MLVRVVGHLSTCRENSSRGSGQRCHRDTHCVHGRIIQVQGPLHGPLRACARSCTAFPWHSYPGLLPHCYLQTALCAANGHRPRTMTRNCSQARGESSNSLFPSYGLHAYIHGHVGNVFYCVFLHDLLFSHPLKSETGKHVHYTLATLVATCV
jgi:hypothetical protein